MKSGLNYLAYNIKFIQYNQQESDSPSVESPATQQKMPMDLLDNVQLEYCEASGWSLPTE